MKLKPRRYATLLLATCLFASCYEKAEPLTAYRDDSASGQTEGDPQSATATADGSAQENTTNPTNTDPANPANSMPAGTTPTTSAPTAVATGTTPATGTTAISFTPKTYTGANYPAFVYAVWVTDANNKYIKTIRAQAGTRMRYLDKWLTSAGVVLPTQPDGVAGATISFAASAPVAITWDMKDKAGVIVPQGNYNINFQLTSSNNTGLSLVVPVTINATGIAKTDSTMVGGVTAVSITHTP